MSLRSSLYRSRKPALGRVAIIAMLGVCFDWPLSGCSYCRPQQRGAGNAAPPPQSAPQATQIRPVPQVDSRLLPQAPASPQIIQAAGQTSQEGPSLSSPMPAKPGEAASSGSTTPAGQAAPQRLQLSPAERIHEIARCTAERYQGIDSYIARMRRRERIGSKDRPEELMVIKFRKSPWSIYFKWLGAEGHNREVIFVEGKYENKMQTLLAAGDMPLMPAGKRFAILPDSPLVRNSSRHTIREAGIGSLVERFVQLVAMTERGDFRLGTLQYIGMIRRPEFEQPCEAIEQTVPPGADPTLPRGGRRLWVFDPAQCLPVLVILRDEANQEVEYYCYDRIQYPVRLDDRDFDPDFLWGKRQ